MANLHALTDTWNNSGVVYRSIRVDVTDTASDADSMFFEFLVGGSEKIWARKDGALSANELLAVNSYTDASNYERAFMRFEGNAVKIGTEAAGTGAVRDIHISNLPTANPGPGILWNNGGTPAIGT